MGKRMNSIGIFRVNKWITRKFDDEEFWKVVDNIERLDDKKEKEMYLYEVIVHGKEV